MKTKIRQNKCWNCGMIGNIYGRNQKGSIKPQKNSHLCKKCYEEYLFNPESIRKAKEKYQINS